MYRHPHNSYTLSTKNQRNKNYLQNNTHPGVPLSLQIGRDLLQFRHDSPVTKNIHYISKLDIQKFFSFNSDYGMFMDLSYRCPSCFSAWCEDTFTNLKGVYQDYTWGYGENPIDYPLSLDPFIISSLDPSFSNL